MTCSCLFGM